MHNVLIGLTYIAMVLSPCCVAQWGHMLSRKVLLRIFLSHAERAAAKLQDVRLEMELDRLGYAATSLGASSPLVSAMNASLEAARLRQRAIASSSASFADGQRRVAARLAQLAHAQQQGSSVSESAPAEVVFATPELPLVHIESARTEPAQASPSQAFVIPEPVVQRPVSVPNRGSDFLQTFEPTGMSMAWNGTAQYTIRTFQPAAGEEDSQDQEQHKKPGDLSKAA